MEPFEWIVAEHGSSVMRVCRALLSPFDADDAWSATFLAAMRHYEDLPPDSNIRGWLVTIAHRKAIDVIRVEARAPRPTSRLPEEASPDGIPEPADDELRRALGRLTLRQRAAVVHHHLAGLSYAEVAVILDCSEAAARRSASDGIAALRNSYRRETRS